MNLYDIFLQHPIITTDSRNCPKASIFFALKGERFNANSFAGDALENGCAYAVIDDASYALPDDERYIIVENVLQSLQNLATTHRKALKTKIIAITGSNGKTTTKELIAAVLKEKYCIHYTQGNLNNHIGVPLTLLQLKQEHQLAIIEMGANHIGEIQQLCEFALPDFGIITNVGKAHLEGFVSFAGVQKAKSELYAYIAQHGKAIFINLDYDYLTEMAEKTGISEEKQITYSLQQYPDLNTVSAKTLPNDLYLNMIIQTGASVEVATQLVGSYNAENVLAAATIGHFFGLNNEQIKRGLESYIPNNNRSQLIATGSNKLIVDAYNANPTSMEYAIINMLQIHDANKMLILGDMLELGDQSAEEHQIIVNLIQENRFKSVYLVGENFAQTQHIYQSFKDSNELFEFLSTNKPQGYTILIKGSRAIQLEKIISLL